jgi:CHAD domain-containing protein
MGVAPPSSPVPRAVIQPDLPIADSARLALAIGVAAMKYHEDAAIAGGIEPLHQMRVATRRLRATVGLFAGVIHGSRARMYNRDLPWLGQAAGEVRECDMIEALVRDCSGQIDPAFAAALGPLNEAIAASRDTKHARFVNDLRTKRYRHMCERLADPLLRNALPAIDVGCNAPAMIDPIARTVRKAGKRISRDAAPEVFHRLRVKIKRLRYALEMLIDMGGKRSRKALIRLEEMQELLGIHQDAVSTMAWLRNYAGGVAGVAPETLMAVGATIQVLTERRLKLAARACREWRRVRHSGIIENALEEISRAAQHRLDAARQAQAASDDEAKAQAARKVEAADDDEARVQAEAVASDSSKSAAVAISPIFVEDSSQQALEAPATDIETRELSVSKSAVADQSRIEAELADQTAPSTAAAQIIEDNESAAAAPPLAEAEAESPPVAEVALGNDGDETKRSEREVALPDQSTSESAAAPDSSRPAAAESAPGSSEVAAPDKSAPAAEGAATPESSDEPPAALHHNESR